MWTPKNCQMRVKTWAANVLAFSNIFNDITIFEDIDIYGSDIYSYFSEMYEEYIIYLMYNTENAAENTTTAARIKTKIELYTMANSYKFTKLIETMKLNYSPVEEFSFNEIISTSEIPNLTKTKATTGTDTTSQTTSGTVENDITTYTTTTYRPDTKATTGGSNSVTNTPNLLETFNETGKKTGSKNTTRSGHTKSNQELIEQQRQLAKLNVLKMYCDGVASVICLDVF